MTLAPELLDKLSQIVGANKLLMDADDHVQYGRDWTRVETPAPAAVVLPGSIEQVQALVQVANAEGLAIVPSVSVAARWRRAVS